MGFFKKGKVESGKDQRVVVTGKRVKGTWVMESTLPTKARRSATNDALLVTENRRVRTLH